MLSPETSAGHTDMYANVPVRHLNCACTCAATRRTSNRGLPPGCRFRARGGMDYILAVAAGAVQASATHRWVSQSSLSCQQCCIQVPAASQHVGWVCSAACALRQTGQLSARHAELHGGHMWSSYAVCVTVSLQDAACRAQRQAWPFRRLAFGMMASCCTAVVYIGSCTAVMYIGNWIAAFCWLPWRKGSQLHNRLPWLTSVQYAGPAAKQTPGEHLMLGGRLKREAQ
jgi:hypothetical protein